MASNYVSIEKLGAIITNSFASVKSGGTAAYAAMLEEESTDAVLAAGSSGGGVDFKLLTNAAAAFSASDAVVELLKTHAESRSQGEGELGTAHMGVILSFLIGFLVGQGVSDTAFMEAKFNVTPGAEEE